MRLLIMVGVVGLLTDLAPCLLAGEKSPAEKAAVEWLYPSATVTSAHKGDAVSCVVQETADDVSKILKHYGKKLSIELIQVGSQSGTRFDGEEATLDFAHVSLKEGTAGGIKTVSIFKTRTAVSTLVVSRSPDGKANTIAITHVPQNAAK